MQWLPRRRRQQPEPEQEELPPRSNLKDIGVLIARAQAITDRIYVQADTVEAVADQFGLPRTAPAGPPRFDQQGVKRDGAQGQSNNG